MIIDSQSVFKLFRNMSTEVLQDRCVVKTCTTLRTTVETALCVPLGRVSWLLLLVHGQI